MNTTNLQSKIAIIEPDRLKREYLRKRINDNGYVPICFANGGICLENLEAVRPEAILVEARSVETFSFFLNGLSMVEKCPPVMVIPQSNDIKQMLNSGSLTGVGIVNSILDKKSISKSIRTIKVKRPDKGIKLPEIIGESSSIKHIRNLIPTLGGLMDPVMIIGEQGVGKELIARSIFCASGKQDKKSIKIDASRITSEDVLKTLFQWRNNGAEPGKKFIFDGEGTILIDKLDQLDKDVQAEMLHIMEHLGNSGMRFISTVSGKIGKKVKSGVFRKDLYYRLGVLKLYIPPLREREEDIAALSDFFTLKFSLGQRKSYYELSQKTKQAFIKYKWPGNVEELYSIVRRIVVNGEETTTEKYLASLEQNNGDGPVSHEKVLDGIYNPDQVKQYLQGNDPIHLKKISDEISVKTEKKLIAYALEKTKWNRKKAADFLDISYKSLLNKIKRYTLD